MTVSESQGPARGYKWRDAWPGNDLALRHGAHSERKVQPIADELAASLCAVRRTSTSPSTGTRSRRGVGPRAERVVLLTAWCDEHGLVDEDGKATGAANLLEKVERAAARCRERLGMDPRSDAGWSSCGARRHAARTSTRWSRRGAGAGRVEGPAPSCRVGVVVRRWTWLHHLVVDEDGAEFGPSRRRTGSVLTPRR